MSNPINDYHYVSSGIRESVNRNREALIAAYQVSTDEVAKENIDGVFQNLQQLANGLNHQARWTFLGSTGESASTPVAPELVGLQTIEEAIAEL